MAEFSSIFDTNGAMRSCAYFFTVKQQDRCYLSEKCPNPAVSSISTTHIARLRQDNKWLCEVYGFEFHTAHLLPSSCLPPLNTFEGEGRRTPQQPGLKTCLVQVCWTCSSSQLGCMHPMVDRSVCKTGSRTHNSGYVWCIVGLRVLDSHVCHFSLLN